MDVAAFRCLVVAAHEWIRLCNRSRDQRAELTFGRFWLVGIQRPAQIMPHHAEEHIPELVDRLVEAHHCPHRSIQSRGVGPKTQDARAQCAVFRDKLRHLKAALGPHVRSRPSARRLIEELLDFTQARVGGGLAVNLQPGNLHEVTAHAIEELRMAYPGQTIVHTTDGPGK